MLSACDDPPRQGVESGIRCELLRKSVRWPLASIEPSHEHRKRGGRESTALRVREPRRHAKKRVLRPAWRTRAKRSVMASFASLLRHRRSAPTRWTREIASRPAQKRVTAYEHCRWEIEASGATFIASDEAVRDGRIVTGQTWQSHPEFYRLVFACFGEN